MENEEIALKKNKGENVDFDCNIFEFLLKNNFFKKDDVAFIYFNVSYTYGKFHEMVLSTTRALQTLNLNQNDKIVISLITTPESISLLYACAVLGIVPIMADVRLSVYEMKDLINNTSPKAVFLSDWQAGFFRELRKDVKDTYFIAVSPVAGMPKFVKINRHIYRFFTNNLFMPWEKGMHWEKFIKRSSNVFCDVVMKGNGESEILFATSGTTGKRKYVILTNKQLNISSYQGTVNKTVIKDVKTVLSIMPIFTCYGFTVSIHLPFILGLKCYINPIYNSKKVPGLIKKTKANAFIGTPGHMERLFNSRKLKNADLSFLHCVISGGEKINGETEEKYNLFLKKHQSDTKILQGYGMTEVASCVTIQNPDMYIAGSAGVPYPQVDIKIVEPETDIAVKEGNKGEICIHTVCQTKGYYENDEGTKNLIKQHGDGLMWIHTGDIGYINKDNLFVEGRIKRMIVTKSGTKVFLQLAEDTVKELEDVSECAIVAVKKNSEYDLRMVYFVETLYKKNNKKVLNSVRLQCLSKLPAYIRPDKIVLMNKLPINNSGKIDYEKLQKNAEMFNKKSVKEKVR